jgi:hypothetical protein
MMMMFLSILSLTPTLLHTCPVATINVSPRHTIASSSDVRSACAKVAAGATVAACSRRLSLSLSQPISIPRLACSLLESASFSLFSLCSTCAPIKQSHSSHLCRRYNQMSQYMGPYSIHGLWAQDEVRAQTESFQFDEGGKIKKLLSDSSLGPNLAAFTSDIHE